MDREIRAQERHQQSEARRQREAAVAFDLQKHAVQVHTQLSQLHKHLPSDPADKSNEVRSGRSFENKDRLDKIEVLATTATPSTSSTVYKTCFSYRFENFIHTIISMLQKSHTLPNTAIVPKAALATVAPILPFGVTTLRDDSTESDQSLIGSQAHPEAIQRYL